MALVAFQCAVNYLYALIMGHTVLKQGEDTTKSSFYACASFTYLLAMVTSNKALSWVNYPTQVIGKSCKPIPVMVLGVVIGRKKYPALKYLFILMIVAGVALFMYKDSAAQKAGSSDGLIGVGELLLLVSLTCDGLTGAVQERMKAEHGTKSGHMMLAMNKWSIGYLLVALLITGEGVEFISFLQRHPSVLWELASFSVASALGQFFHFHDRLRLWAPPLLHHHHHQEILHGFSLGHLLWQQPGSQTVGWHCFCVCRHLLGRVVWEAEETRGGG